MTNQEQAFVEGFVKRASEYGYSESAAIQLLKAANAPASVAMPSRASVMSQPSPTATPAPAPQLPAAIADPSLYQRLGVKFNGNPNYTSPPNKPNEADMMDVAGYRR